MKVQEFIEKYKKLGSVKPITTLITVKNYIPYKSKQSFVEDVVNECVLADQGYIWFDEMYKYLVFTIGIIKMYTNIEFDADFDVAIGEYDAICEANALNDILGAFEGEYKTVLNMLNMYEAQILRGNTLESHVAKFLSNLNEQLGDVVNVLAKQVEEYKGLDLSQENVGKLINFVNTLGK